MTLELEQVIGFFLGIFDGTNDNDELDEDEKLKVKICEREKLKQLRRR